MWCFKSWASNSSDIHRYICILFTYVTKTTFTNGKYITRPIQTNLILIKRKQLTPSTLTLHHVLHREYLLVYQERTNGFGMADFLQKEGRYSVKHVLHYPTVPMKVKTPALIEEVNLG